MFSLFWCEELTLEVCPSILLTSCILLQFLVLRAKKVREREVIVVFNFRRFLECSRIFLRCTNPGRQVARANKFCTATRVFEGSQYGSGP